MLTIAISMIKNTDARVTEAVVANLPLLTDVAMVGSVIHSYS